MIGTLSDHIIMVAYVKNYQFSTGQGIGTISFDCFNRSEVLLDNFIFITENTGAKVPDMIVEAMGKIKTFNQGNVINAYKDYTGTSTPGIKGAYDENGNRVYYTIVDGNKVHNTDGNGTPESGYIRAYKSAAYDSDGNIKWSTIPDKYDDDGNHLYYFKDAVFVETYKAFSQHLDDLSTTEYTGDILVGSYITFVDDSNNIHWQPKRFITASSKDSTINLVLDEYDESVVNIGKDMNNIVNAIIVNCGTDPNEMGILTFSFNATSMGKNGAKWKYIAQTDIADNVRQKELESGTWYSDDGTEHTNYRS